MSTGIARHSATSRAARAPPGGMPANSASGWSSSARFMAPRRGESNGDPRAVARCRSPGFGEGHSAERAPVTGPLVDIEKRCYYLFSGSVPGIRNPHTSHTSVISMRVVCDSCGATYKIPDTKLVKDVNRATCRKCGHRCSSRSPKPSAWAPTRPRRRKKSGR
jgi:hypothetical protein